jgi:hypothetical protein
VNKCGEATGCVDCCFILLFRWCIISAGSPLFFAICVIAFISFCFLYGVKGNWFTRLLKQRYAASFMFYGVIGGEVYSSFCSCGFSVYIYFQFVLLFDNE